ncbi:MAG: AI-2E family transporter [Bryobacteraceae bacterium]
MIGIDRSALKIAWTVFLFALMIALVYGIRHTLMVFALALFFSHLLTPVVSFFERMAPKRFPHVAILALVYIALLAVIVLTLISVGSRIGEQAASLVARLPDLARQQDPLSRLPIPAWLEFARPRLAELLRERLKDLGENVLPILSSAGMQILSGIGNVLSTILIPILGFFFLKDGPAMREAIVESFDRAHRPLVHDILADVHLLLAQYIRALVLLAISTFIFYTVFLSTTSVAYAFLLAGIAAVCEFIPVVGPLTASAVILLVAAFTEYPHLLWIVVFLAIYRIFQDYVLSPYLMSSGVEIHPLLVLFGVLAGEQIGGVPGMFFSVPVMAALRVVYVRLRRQRRATA